ncbi:tryptophan synthase subunit alpha [Alicyclobacillus sp. SO9]|uniref:tryptophan synthase subunit alpha n=1 Tax=Alicyclobacillus sp. SO9 TaxID=2665646 RepID=UPI0018E7E39C|nr:tryptophan synthase subunit alpha [Alicyclobacillus sp. SO9]QQE76797.1 tryptophan synthase subunit alpha [Alicyclobacillus sp. SO9]
MNRIEKAFQNAQRSAAFMPFLTAGDPTFDMSLQLFDAVLTAGADIVEIGVPYSDPLADGPVIQNASLRSIKAGFSLPEVFKLAAELRHRHPNKGLVLFTYVNPVLQFSPQAFFRETAKSGADGVIIPDLPFEETDRLRDHATANGIALIPLITPVSSEQRIQRICERAEGFVYCVSALGVTGERQSLSQRVEEMVDTARRYTSLPLAVGFGVSTPSQAAAISQYADGVIVGSAVIRRLEQALASVELSDKMATERIIEQVVPFVSSLMGAMNA